MSMKINPTSNTTFTGSAFKILNKRPSNEILRSAAMASVGENDAVLIAKAGEEGDNAMKALLKKSGLQEGIDYIVGKVDYMKKYMESSDRGVLNEAKIEFNPELAIMKQAKPQQYQYYVPGDLQRQINEAKGLV